ncbi:MAG: helix-turn-helix transcriptional regulator [Rhodospirillales bacterium]|nr:helix-turn-helix transcriptional regulator [Acetobacter sp.]
MRGSVASLHSAPYKRFLREVRAMRADAGLTQEQLAKKLRQSQTYVSKSESGERRLDLVEWLAFCRACRHDPKAFLDRL